MQACYPLFHHCDIHVSANFLSFFNMNLQNVIKLLTKKVSFYSVTFKIIEKYLKNKLLQP